MGINRAVAEKIIEAENRCDGEAVASLYAEDAIYVDPSGTTQGRAAIAELYRGFFEAFPDAHRTIERAVEEGDWGAFEGVMTATHTGPFHVGAATVPATGRRLELRFMAIAQTRDGQAAYARLYFDQLDVMMQLGLMPQPPTQ
jgi:steroid delta-isomerase-like uncharacterized protein